MASRLCVRFLASQEEFGSMECAVLRCMEGVLRAIGKNENIVRKISRRQKEKIHRDKIRRDVKRSAHFGLSNAYKSSIFSGKSERCAMFLFQKMFILPFQ